MLNPFGIKTSVFRSREQDRGTLFCWQWLAKKHWSSALDKDGTGFPTSFTRHWPFCFTSLTCKTQGETEFILLPQHGQVLIWFPIQKCFTSGHLDRTVLVFGSFFYLFVLLRGKAAEWENVVSPLTGFLLCVSHLNAAAPPLRCLSHDEWVLLQHFSPLFEQLLVAASVSHREEDAKSANKCGSEGVLCIVNHNLKKQRLLWTAGQAVVSISQCFFPLYFGRESGGQQKGDLGCWGCASVAVIFTTVVLVSGSFSVTWDTITFVWLSISNRCRDSVFVLADSTVTLQLSQVTCCEHTIIVFFFSLTGRGRKTCCCVFALWCCGTFCWHQSDRKVALMPNKEPLFVSMIMISVFWLRLINC